MALIKRDVLNPNKLEVVTVEQALAETMRMASLGYESEADRVATENTELKLIMGRLLNTLTEKHLLTEHDLNKILSCYTITVGRPQE